MRLSYLDLGDREIAVAVFELQRRAYRVEADLIGFDCIPALHETLPELQRCDETFMGAMLDEGRLAGVVSWRFRDRTIDIHRLVVDPDGFRRGTGTLLVRAALRAESDAEWAIVQTGADNAPARALYLREGFEVAGEDEVGGGLRVVRFVMRLG